MALYFRVFDSHPLIVAANRDEHYDRPSAAPSALHTAPEVIAGRDLRAGGTWLGVNESGLAVGILNRRPNGEPLPVADARSRGMLCMDLLLRRSAAEAHEFVASDQVRYNPFTLLFADRHAAYASYNDEQRIITQRLQPGLHVFSSAADFDLHSAKAKRAYLLFAELENRHLGADLNPSVAALQTVLGDHSLPPGSDNPGDAICVHRDGSGTVSASILFFSESASRFENYYCDGKPCRNSFGPALSLDVR